MDKFLIWKQAEQICMQLIHQAEATIETQSELLKIAQAKLKKLPKPTERQKKKAAGVV